MGRITVCGGQTVIGRFRLAGRESKPGRIKVCSVLEFPPRAGRKPVYLFGWFQRERGPRKLVAMSAEYWAAYRTKNGIGPGIPAGNWFVTPGRDIFAFIENVAPEEQECARRLGARPISEFAVENARLVCVPEGP
jgi:hypothetical protein